MILQRKLHTPQEVPITHKFYQDQRQTVWVAENTLTPAPEDSRLNGRGCTEGPSNNKVAGAEWERISAPWTWDGNAAETYEIIPSLRRGTLKSVSLYSEIR